MKELPVLEAYHKNPKQLGLYDCRKERGACKENKSCRLIKEYLRIYYRLPKSSESGTQ